NDSLFFLFEALVEFSDPTNSKQRYQTDKQSHKQVGGNGCQSEERSRGQELSDPLHSCADSKSNASCQGQSRAVHGRHAYRISSFKSKRILFFEMQCAEDSSPH